MNEQLSAGLDRLAAMRDRSLAWLIDKAVAEFVRENLALHDTFDEANGGIERGGCYTQEEVMAGLRAEFGRQDAA